jgi:hypothetical protein
MTKKGLAVSDPHLCVECFQHVELADCLILHPNDGGPALTGHWRNGQLCGPVLNETRLSEDIDGLGVIEFDKPT